MSIQQDQRSQWKTDAAFLGFDSLHDSIGICLSADIEDDLVREGYVTLFTDTPEFPENITPCTFETTNVHLTPARARELSAKLAELADVMEHHLTPVDPSTLGNTIELPDKPAQLEWKEWVRTHASADEWTCWDITTNWFLSIDHEDSRWRWMAAYAPEKGEHDIEHRGWVDSKADAEAQAKGWAERHALEPELLSGQPLTPK